MAILIRDRVVEALRAIGGTQQGVIAAMKTLPLCPVTGLPLAVEVGSSYLSDIVRQKTDDPTEERVVDYRVLRALAYMADWSMDYMVGLTDDRTAYWRKSVIVMEVDDKDERDILETLLDAFSTMPRDAQRAFAGALGKMVGR